MWYNNKKVKNISAAANTKCCHAIIDGIPGLTGWIQIAPTSADGVTNILDILATAKMHNKNVNVDINGNKITGVYMA